MSPPLSCEATPPATSRPSSIQAGPASPALLQQLTPTPPGRLNLRVAMSMRAAELTRSSALQSRAAEATAKANALMQSPPPLPKTPSLSPDDARAIAEARAAQLQARPSRRMNDE